MVQDILPKDNLTYDDIKDTLNVNGDTVSNVVETAFYNTAGINMWSRMKPVNLKANSPTTDDWWKGYDGKCGINSDNAFKTDWRLVSNLYSLENNGYVYTKINTPYRLGDFRGYYAGSQRPSKDFKVVNKQVSNAQGAILETLCSLTPQYNDDTTAGSLSLLDMSIDPSSTLGDCYPGVVIYIGGEAKYIQTNNNPVNTNSVVNIQVPTIDWVTGNYTVYPILATERVDNGQATQTGCRFYAMPCVLSDTFKVVAPAIPETTISIRAFWVGGLHNQINYEVYAKQDEADSKTYDRNRIEFLYGSFDSTHTVDDYTEDIATFTLPRSKQNTLIASGTITKPFTEGDYYVKVVLTDTNGKVYVSPETEHSKVLDLTNNNNVLDLNDNDYDTQRINDRN